MPAPVVAAAAARSAGAGAARAGAGRAAASRGAGKAAASAAQQRAAIDAIKASREPEPAATAEPATTSTRSSTSSSGGRRLPSALTDQRGAPSWTRPDPVRAANSGAGFVLGLGLYAAGLVYLREGAPGVKRWLAAKFLNRVEG